MKLHAFALGPMQANCYILECEETKKAILIDPGSESSRILNFIKGGKFHLDFIVNTHAHIDHIGANAGVKDGTSALLCIHRSEAEMLLDPEMNLSAFMGIPVSSPPADRLLEDGDILESGTLRLKVIHTPGHSPGSICLLNDGCIFTGDLLFAGGIGRYDFPGSSYRMLMNSLRKIMELDDECMVYPGHGPETTIGTERITNPFI